MEKFVNDELQHMYEAFYSKCIDYLIDELAFDQNEASEIMDEFMKSQVKKI